MDTHTLCRYLYMYCRYGITSLYSLFSYFFSFSFAFLFCFLFPFSVCLSLPLSLFLLSKKTGPTRKKKMTLEVENLSHKHTSSYIWYIINNHLSR